jgi:small redox-active disulfide protein 2
MEVKVLGTGCCGSCKTTAALIEEVARAKGLSIQLTKVEDLKDIMGYGVMSTPGVVIDGKVVHAGGIPSRERIAQWIEGAAA